MSEQTITQAIVARLAQDGVRHVFGVPGGECNLDFIAAIEAAGLSFVLTRTETAAAIMASVSAELTGAPGVVMTTRGPGLLSAANGVAYAALDRAPLVVIADGYDEAQGYVSHQRVDQTAVLRPYVKADSALSGPDPLGEFDALLAAATAQPPGPVYVEVAGSRIRRRAPPSAPAPPASAPVPAPVEAARALLARASRPIVIAGLQARSVRASAALRDFAAAAGCPILTTYKAKGAADETDPLTLGHYIGGVAERAAIEAADLVVLYGFDPVEGPPQAWGYDKPLLEFTEHLFDTPLVEAEVSVVGDIAAALSATGLGAGRCAWTAEALAAFKRDIRARAAMSTEGGLSPQAVVEAAAAAAPADARITVDAGAHMMPVMHLWASTEPNRALISRGLSTMGFALPAAVASALCEPQRRVIAFTGDGGLMMCLGELGTAVQQGAAPVVIVFNDSNLTLIGVKQARRQLAPAGVAFSPTDFAQIARGFGWRASRVDSREALDRAVAEALASDQPTLIDAVVDPRGYGDQIEALRG